MSKYVASIDVGTTNIKINLFDSNYEVIDVLKYAHINIYNTDDKFELDLNEIWDNIFIGLNTLISQNEIEQLEVILTTAMHSVQLMKDDFSLSGLLITWGDKRGGEAIKDLPVDTLEKQYDCTGTPIHSMNPFFKLLNLKEKITKDQRIGSLKDVLFYRLTGEWALDVSNASSSGLYNLYESSWDARLLNMIGINKEQLPEIKDINYNKSAKSSLFNAKVDVFIGTSDGISSNYVFNDLEDVAVLSVGTSHAVRIIHNKVLLDKKFQNFSYVIDKESYLIGLPSNNGADILLWTNKIFNSTFNELNKIAAKRPKTKTFFVPFLNGERAPIWNEFATSNLYDLTRTSTRESVLFSIILGMIFNIKQNVENLAEMVEFKGIGLVGQVTKLEDFSQLIADILHYPLYIPTIDNAETLGSIAVVKNINVKKQYKVIEPNKTYTYHEMYKSYLELVEIKK